MNPKAGFSLLELLVVLVIICLMTAMVVPRMGGVLENIHLKTSVKKVAASLRYARHQAISKHKTYLAKFDFKENRLRIGIKDTLDIDLGVETIDEKQDVKSDDLEDNTIEQIQVKIYDLPEGVRFEKATDLKGEEASDIFDVLFYPGGNSSGGEVTLSNEKDRQFTLKVDFITGTTKLVE